MPEAIATGSLGPPALAGRAFHTAPAGIFMGAIAVTAIALLPFLFVAAVTLNTDWAVIRELLFRPRVGELLANSALLVALTLPLCVVLGTGLAWLTECSNLPGRRFWSWLVTAPLAIPAFVHSYAWVSMVPQMHGLAAAVLLSILAYLPFLYLPVAAALRRMDPALEDVAASLGYTRWQAFLRVVFPQLRIALCGGGLLIGLHLLAEYGLYALVRFDTFTTAIYDQFQSSFNGVAANMIASVLVICCLALLAAEVKLRGNVRYARLGAGSARTTPAARLPAFAKWLLLALLAGYVLLGVGVPLATLARWLAEAGGSVWNSGELLDSLLQTMGYAAIGALLTVAVAVPMAWLSIRAPGPWQRTLEACNYLTGSLPGIVVALGLVTFTVRFALPLYQTVATLLLAYALLFLPRALVSLRSGIAQAPVELEYVARSLGRTPRQALWTVTMRIALPGAAAGAAMVFLGVTNELTATLLLSPNGTNTLATSFWAKSAELDYAAAAPYALLMILLSLPLTWLLYAQSKKLSGR